MKNPPLSEYELFSRQVRHVKSYMAYPFGHSAIPTMSNRGFSFVVIYFLKVLRYLIREEKKSGKSD